MDGHEHLLSLSTRRRKIVSSLGREEKPGRGMRTLKLYKQSKEATFTDVKGKDGWLDYGYCWNC